MCEELQPFHPKVCSPCKNNVSGLLKKCYINKRSLNTCSYTTAEPTTSSWHPDTGQQLPREIPPSPTSSRLARHLCWPLCPSNPCCVKLHDAPTQPFNGFSPPSAGKSSADYPEPVADHPSAISAPVQSPSSADSPSSVS